MSSWFGFASSKAASPQKKSEADEVQPSSVAVRHSAYRRRADEGAVFTASKCPPGPGLQNSCELPFGFVWSPMAVYNHEALEDGANVVTNEADPKRQAMPIIQCRDHLPPVLCLACMAYMNPFVEMNYETGIWVCPLCGQENAAPLDQLQEGSDFRTALQFACVEYRQPPQSEEEKKEIDNHDNSILEDEEDDSCSYILVVDENLAPKDGQAITPAVEALLKEHADKKDFPKIRIGLIVFGKSVWTYHLGIPDVISSDLYVAADPTLEVNLDEVLDMERRAYLAEWDPSESMTTLKNAIASVFHEDKLDRERKSTNGNSDISPTFSPRMAMLSKRREERLRKEQTKNNNNGGVEMPTESPWIKRRKESKFDHPVRCTGEAVQCALDLASANIHNPSRTSRIILFTNGCPNSGDGSVVAVGGDTTPRHSKKNGKRPVHDVVETNMLQKSVDYFDMTGKIAVSNGIGFDVFCAGATELALPAYQALVEPSGGYVVPLLSFETGQMEYNLKFLLEHTYMSRSRFIPEEIQDDEAGAECILDIRTDGFISPSQLCGSGEVLPDQASRMVENERPAFAMGSALAAEKGIKTNDLPSIEAMEMSMTRVQVGRVDPMTTFAVMLEVEDTMAEDDDYAFFQLVSRYVSRRGNEEITRVCSFKLPVAKDVSEFVASVDDEAVSVVLGKAAVYRALHGREETSETRDVITAGDENSQERLAYETQLDLDATIQRVSGAFRLLGLEEKMRRYD
jgi:Sec23/Sec24 zinc finger/Sec23/Sec24 trunk domain